MATEAADAAPARIPMVIDTDPGADDALALALMAADPGVEIVAVGSVHGNLPAAMAADNALRTLQVLGIPQVPVAVGADLPLAGDLGLMDGRIVHGQDGLGGHAGPPPLLRPIAESAADQLVRLARQIPGRLHVLALGPLTNLALALRREPALPSLLAQVVWMGGVIDCAGNVGFRQDANTWHDPEAAEDVLAAGFPLVMVPMDATADAWAGAAWLEALRSSSSLRARWAHAVLEQYVQAYSSTLGELHHEHGCVLYDPLAAAIAADPSLITAEETHQVVVELAGHGRGATLVDRRDFIIPGTELPPRPPVRVVMRARAEVMLTRLAQALED